MSDRTKVGRLPAAPGSRPSDRAADGFSPVPASIPSAGFLAEHEAWFAEQRRNWNDVHPVPVAAWDGSSLYRQIQNHTTAFLRQLRPLADAWWGQRGYSVDWSAGTVSPHPHVALADAPEQQP